MFKKSLLFIALLASGSAACASTEVSPVSTKSIEKPVSFWQKTKSSVYNNRGKALIVAFLGLILWDGLHTTDSLLSFVPAYGAKDSTLLKGFSNRPIQSILNINSHGLRKVKKICSPKKTT